jgi:hypothetical protein
MRSEKEHLLIELNAMLSELMLYDEVKTAQAMKDILRPVLERERRKREAQEDIYDMGYYADWQLNIL